MSAICHIFFTIESQSNHQNLVHRSTTARCRPPAPPRPSSRAPRNVAAAAPILTDVAAPWTRARARLRQRCGNAHRGNLNTSPPTKLAPDRWVLLSARHGTTPPIPSLQRASRQPLHRSAHGNAHAAGAHCTCGRGQLCLVYSGREAVKQPFVSGSALSFETLMHLALDLLLVDFC
jgi:hypothetical protein